MNFYNKKLLLRKQQHHTQITNEMLSRLRRIRIPGFNEIVSLMISTGCQFKFPTLFTVLLLAIGALGILLKYTYILKQILGILNSTVKKKLTATSCKHLKFCDSHQLVTNAMGIADLLAV